MRFGLAATAALLACATMPHASSGVSVRLPANVDNPTSLPSVARATSVRGMNAAQLERLSAKNARRKRRR